MKRQKSVSELIKFIIGGGINTAFTYCFYYGLQTVLHYQVAYTLAFVTGIVFSYWFNSMVVFKTSISLKGIFAFPLVYLVQYLVSLVLLSALVERLGIPQSFAPLLVTALSIPITFALTHWSLHRT